ncbi:MAG: hypothetical protein BWZ06_01943 [Bacteroidetes bacterium ADurb.BinA261]|nr:MAG: hypothetical protein BWZ06_01943 [Bacteroidetes bacterium ADurb.BinA261]
MYGNVVLSQKIIQSTVGIQSAKHVKFGNIFHRQISGLPFMFQAIPVFLNRSKLYRIVFPLQRPRIEQVIGFLHIINFRLYNYCSVILSFSST